MKKIKKKYNIDKLYKDWSGVHHTTNSNLDVHDSAEAQDFAEYCIKEVFEAQIQARNEKIDRLELEMANPDSYDIWRSDQVKLIEELEQLKIEW